jgi:hypothetical protein
LLDGLSAVLVNKADKKKKSSVLDPYVASDQAFLLKILPRQKWNFKKQISLKRLSCEMDLAFDDRYG